MKRVLVAVMVVMMIFCCISVVHAIDYVTDADVNVRDPKTHESLKNQSGSSIVIRRWNIVNVIDDSDKFWLLIRMPDGREGIIYKEYAHIGHAEELEEIQNRQKQGIKITNDDASFIGLIREDCKVFKKANGKVIGNYNAEDTVYVRQLGRYWYKIIWNGKEIGYVQSKKVQLVDANIPGYGEVLVMSENTAVRQIPQKNSLKVATLKKNSCVRVVEMNDDWSLVTYNSYGDTGYVPTNRLKNTKLFDFEQE